MTRQREIGTTVPAEKTRSRGQSVIMLLLFLLTMPLLAAPAFIVRDNEPWVQLRAVAPLLDIYLSYDARRHRVNIQGNTQGTSFILGYGQGNTDPTHKLFNPAFFPEYPGWLYVSRVWFAEYTAIFYWDRDKSTAVLFNPQTGKSDELKQDQPSTILPALTSLKHAVTSPKPWDIAGLRQLLARHPALFQSCGLDFLLYAGENGDMPALTLLLDTGVPPDIRDERPSFVENSETALMKAVRFQRHDAAMLLLTRGANASYATRGESILQLAVQNNDPALVQALLDHKANLRTATQQSPLFQAIKLGNLAMVKLLVTHGAPLDCRNEKDQTPLLAALDIETKFMSDDVRWMSPPQQIASMVEYLFTAGAAINVVDRANYSPLDYAVKLVDLHLYQYLLARGAKLRLDEKNAPPMLTLLLKSAIEVQEQRKTNSLLGDRYQTGPQTPMTPQQKTEFQQASAQYTAWIAGIAAKMTLDLPALYADLVKRGADIHAMDEMGLTPLHFAVQLPDLSYTRKLLVAGAEVNAHRLPMGDYPLHSAVNALNSAGVLMLLEHGAEVNAIGGDQGKTALMLLDRKPGWNDNEPQKTDEHRDILAIARLLLDHHAEITARDTGNGWQAIHHAAWIGYPDLVALLLDHGADIEAKDSNKSTPLGIAAEGLEPETVKLLIAHGANVSVHNNDGNTPLHQAVLHDNAAAVDILLQHGLPIDARNNEGLSALDLANREESHQAAAILRKHHARAWKFVK